MKTKKGVTPKRAPRQVWLVVDGDDGLISQAFCSRAGAKGYCTQLSERVVGPYVLAERVRER